MGTSTLAALRIKISQNIGDYLVGVTTAGAAGGASISMTGLSKYPDTHFAYWYAVITVCTTATLVGHSQQISTFVSSGGVLTPFTAFNVAGTGTAVPSGSTFELHRFAPDDFLASLNRAANECFPYVSRRIVDESLITGNWLQNGGFEDWASSSVPDKWANNSAITLSKNTSYLQRIYGTNALLAACLADGDGVVQSTTQNKMLLNLIGKTVNFAAWVAGVSGGSLVRVTQTSGSTDSSTLAASAAWELLEIEDLVIASTSRTAQFKIVSNAAASFYADNARVWGPPIRKYYLPTPFRQIQRVDMQTGHYNSTYPCDDIMVTYAKEQLRGYHVLEDGTDRFLEFDYDLPANYKLRVTGRGVLSTLAADTDTMEVDGPQADTLTCYATALLYQQRAGTPASQDRARDLQERDYWYAKFEMLKKQHCVMEPAYLPH